MIQSIKDYELYLELLHFLESLELKQAKLAEYDCIQTYHDEYGECPDCYNVMPECECSSFDEDCDDYDYEPSDDEPEARNSGSQSSDK